MRNLTNIITLCFCLIAGKGVAQPIYKTTLPVVGSDGFYAIDLPYEIVGGAQRNLSDIRIKDTDGRETAWLFQEDVERNRSSEFVPFESSVSSVHRQTEVLITTGGVPVSTFVLRMKNADADKKASLRGSNDRRSWFAVKDRFLLSNTNHPNRTEAFLELDFPLSDYLYYKLSINDSLSAPLNITGVGLLKNESSYKKHLLSVPLQGSSVKSNGQFTDIELILPFKYQVSELAFYISSPQYYKRDLKMYLAPVEQISPDKHRRKRQRHDYASHVFMNILSADGGKPLSVEYNQYTDTIRMSVFNGDDQPLSIDSIKVYIPKLYLVAGLKKGMAYSLTFGDETTTFPNYDLSFREQLPDSIVHLAVGAIERLPVAGSADSNQWMYFLKKYAVWLIIGLVIMQILYAIRKMVKP